MAILLAELLDQVPRETETLVDRARQRFNQSIRQILRAETRLHLSNIVAGKEGDERETRAVRVFVTPGMPIELERMEFDDSLWLAIELAPLKGLLDSVHTNMLELSAPIKRLSEHPEFEKRFPRAMNVISDARDLAAKLLAEAAKFDLLERIFAINEDVLGLYSYHLPKVKSPSGDEEPPQNVRSDLYWGVIGLVSRMLGVTVEALAVKVLAHELAHAYTHIGIDADGKCWDSHAFAKTESGLKEGLAQYYTVRVLDRLERQIPAAKKAYGKLLPHQPKRYSTHIPWLDNYTPEEVRHAMLRTRRIGVGTVEHFNQTLVDSRERLRSKAQN